MGQHLARIREYVRLLAETLLEAGHYAGVLAEEEIDTLADASALHDIGKVCIPDRILLKRGPLTDEEFAVMRTHAGVGARTLREVDRDAPGNAFVRMGIDMAATHHERWDGGGYPEGLAGEAIPPAGRILAVADVYDALTSERCYKAAFTVTTARKIVLSEAERHFAPEVVEAFRRVEPRFREVHERYRQESRVPVAALAEEA